MPKFLIIGAHRQTGEDVRLTITADSAADAEAVANARGIITSRIIEQTEQAASPQKPTTTPLRQWLRIISGTLAAILFVLGFTLSLSNGAPFGTAVAMGGVTAFLPLVWFLALFVNRAV